MKKVHKVLLVLHVWTEILDQVGNLDIIYCDFIKAFDKVPHKRLLHKIKGYGITGNVLGWIDSFLSNRTQCVIINNTKSTSSLVTSGIPEGSVLGPILFVLYIYDHPDVVDKYSHVFLFADDTKVFREINSPEDLQILQNYIDNLTAWSDKWVLKLHPDKCVTMNMGSNNLNHQYHMGQHDLSKTECEKCIGVYIDFQLKFHKHISNMINKANRVLAITRKTFEYQDKSTTSLIF